jgi:hypothetical protein
MDADGFVADRNLCADALYWDVGRLLVFENPSTESLDEPSSLRVWDARKDAERLPTDEGRFHLGARHG